MADGFTMHAGFHGKLNGSFVWFSLSVGRRLGSDSVLVIVVGVCSIVAQESLQLCVCYPVLIPCSPLVVVE
jgi:hypothetical protein